MISTVYAYRSLTRHIWRSFLSVAGIGIGIAICLFMIGFVGGEEGMMRKAAALSGTGHIKVVPEAWKETRAFDLRLDGWRELRAKLEALEGIGVVTPQASIDGLLGFGTRMAGVLLQGVDPETEPTVNRLIRDVKTGRYLKADEHNAVVIGKGIAKRLKVGHDDELMLTVSGKDGEMCSAMLRIVGIVETGSEDLDNALCHISLAELQRITKFEGAANLTVLVKDPESIEEELVAIRASLPKGTIAMPWNELMPELAAGVEVDRAWSRMVIGIIMTVVFLGIASAQLSAVLERRKEFAVLSALGMKSRRLVMIMVMEGLILGLVGAIVGLILGVPATYYVATEGIDFSKIYGDMDMAVSNILMDPILYGDFGWWLLPLSFFLSLTATMLSSLYPAWFAVRTNPATALRVEQ